MEVLGANGNGVAFGSTANVGVSVQAFNDPTGKVSGVVDLQFATQYYQASVISVSPITVDSKGTQRSSILALGSLISNGNTVPAVRAFCSISLTEAPGSRGTVTVSFGSFDKTKPFPPQEAVPFVSPITEGVVTGEINFPKVGSVSVKNQ